MSPIQIKYNQLVDTSQEEDSCLGSYMSISKWWWRAVISSRAYEASSLSTWYMSEYTQVLKKWDPVTKVSTEW